MSGDPVDPTKPRPIPKERELEEMEKLRQDLFVPSLNLPLLLGYKLVSFHVLGEPLEARATDGLRRSVR